MKERAGPDVRARTVDRPVIGVGTLAVYVELAEIEARWIDGGGHHSRRELDQALETSPIQRQVFSELPIHDRAHGRVRCIDVQIVGPHRDSLRDRADLQTEISNYIILYI